MDRTTEDMTMKPYALHVERADESLDAWVAGGREPADYTSREGAMALKAKIEAYWRERGKDVLVALHNVGFHPAIRAARFDVRSDMVNGLPRANAAKKAAAGSWTAANDEECVESFGREDDDIAFE